MNQRWKTGRVEAFSDGVFAIAITLLLPKLAAFGYFVVAAVAVLTARGEGRLTLRGPPG